MVRTRSWVKDESSIDGAAEAFSRENEADKLPRKSPMRDGDGRGYRETSPRGAYTSKSKKQQLAEARKKRMMHQGQQPRMDDMGGPSQRRPAAVSTPTAKASLFGPPARSKRRRPARGGAPLPLGYIHAPRAPTTLMQQRRRFALRAYNNIRNDVANHSQALAGVGSIVEMSSAWVSSLIKEYQADPAACLAKTEPLPRGRPKKKLSSPEVVEAIDRLVYVSYFTTGTANETLTHLCEMVETDFNIKCHPSTMRRHLLEHGYCHTTFQKGVSTLTTNPVNIKFTANFVLSLSAFITTKFAEGHKYVYIIFHDETWVYSDDCKHEGWIRVGMPSPHDEVLMREGGKGGQRLNVMGAVVARVSRATIGGREGVNTRAKKKADAVVRELGINSDVAEKLREAFRFVEWDFDVLGFLHNHKRGKEFKAVASPQHMEDDSPVSSTYLLGAGRVPGTVANFTKEHVVMWLRNAARVFAAKYGEDAAAMFVLDQASTHTADSLKSININALTLGLKGKSQDDHDGDDEDEEEEDEEEEEEEESEEESEEEGTQAVRRSTRKRKSTSSVDKPLTRSSRRTRRGIVQDEHGSEVLVVVEVSSADESSGEAGAAEKGKDKGKGKAKKTAGKAKKKKAVGKTKKTAGKTKKKKGTMTLKKLLVQHDKWDELVEAQGGRVSKEYARMAARKLDIELQLERTVAHDAILAANAELGSEYRAVFMGKGFSLMNPIERYWMVVKTSYRREDLHDFHKMRAHVNNSMSLLSEQTPKWDTKGFWNAAWLDMWRFVCINADTTLAVADEGVRIGAKPRRQRRTGARARALSNHDVEERVEAALAAWKEFCDESAS